MQQTNNKVDLKSFNNSEFDKGASTIKIMLWYITNALIVRASWNPFIGIKFYYYACLVQKLAKALL